MSSPAPALLWNRQQAARALGISERSLFSATKSGTIPFVRIGSRVLYSVDALKKWVDQQAPVAPEVRP
jgi:excisionase family DNA binding protein